MAEITRKTRSSITFPTSPSSRSRSSSKSSRQVGREAAPVAVAARWRRCGCPPRPPKRRRSSRSILADAGANKINVIKVGPRDHGPRPERGEGPGRRRAQGRSRKASARPRPRTSRRSSKRPAPRSSSSKSLLPTPGQSSERGVARGSRRSVRRKQSMSARFAADVCLLGALAAFAVSRIEFCVRSFGGTPMASTVQSNFRHPHEPRSRRRRSSRSRT